MTVPHFGQMLFLTTVSHFEWPENINWTTVARFEQLFGDRRFISEDSCTLSASRGAWKYAILIEVDHSMTKKGTRVVFCEFEVCNTC